MTLFPVPFHQCYKGQENESSGSDPLEGPNTSGTANQPNIRDFEAASRPDTKIKPGV